MKTKLLAALLTLALVAGVARTLWPLLSTGQNDFLGLWIGAKLAGSSDLYNRDRILAEQRAAVGGTNPALMWVRPPWVALLYKPLGLMPTGSRFWCGPL